LKLIITIAHDRDKNRLSEALLRNSFQFTKIGSTGGFLREGNTTLLIGVEDDDLERCLSTIRESCRTREQFVNALPADAAPVGAFLSSPVKVQVGGAVVFVLSVDRFERY
jgi:uncharacterized protein YaaQ